MNLKEKQYRKKYIEEVVSAFIKKFPIDYMSICHSVKKQRGFKKDQWGLTDKDSAYMRWTLRLPAKLFKILDNKLIHPRFLEDQSEIDWFKKRFREFRVSEKV